MLAGEGEHALDDHVVDRHGLDQRLEVLGLAARRSTRECSISSKRTPNSWLMYWTFSSSRACEVVGLEHADLGVEAVEERDVARLVGDLRAEEDPHVLVGAARIIGPSSAATRCSPMKNDDSPYMRCEALLGVDALVPVDAVLREVDVLRRPLLALPQRVELP